MNTKFRFLVAAGFVLLSAALSVIAAPELPERIVTHWNAAGEPDGTMSKTLGVALLPGLSAALLVLFALVPRIDPRKANIDAFRPTYDWFVVVFTAFMAVLHGGIIAFNLGYEFDFTLLVLGGVAALFYCVGLLLARAKRNWFVGIRTPWTLESDEVWDRTHELGSRLFKLTAVIAVVGLLFEEYAVYFVLVPALLTAVITVVYSYVRYQQLDERPETDAERSSNGRW